MTIWFVSRHPGAQEWARRQGLVVDRWVTHLESIESVAPDDTVAGTLPVQIAARICARGACYLHLSVDLPAHARGKELNADELEHYGARLEVTMVSHPHQGSSDHE